MERRWHFELGVLPAQKALEALTQGRVDDRRHRDPADVESAVLGFGVKPAERFERLEGGPDQAALHVFEMVDVVAEPQRRMASRRLALVGVEIKIVDPGGMGLRGAQRRRQDQQRENGEPDQW